MDYSTVPRADFLGALALMEGAVCRMAAAAQATGRADLARVGREALDEAHGMIEALVAQDEEGDDAL